MEFESGQNPLLSESDFDRFFPSWSRKLDSISRKKRATLIQESRLFNFTGSGFATLSYDWRDVIGTYINYALTGGLILALTSFLSAPDQNLVPFQLPTLPDSVLPKVNPVEIPPNLPEGTQCGILRIFLPSLIFAWNHICESLSIKSYHFYHSKALNFVFVENQNSKFLT